MTSLKLKRRAVLTGMAIAAPAAILSGGAFAQSAFAGNRITVEQAHDQAMEGQVFLIDIRRPDEWTETGSGEGAHRMDMREPRFVSDLLSLVAGDPDAPIALICRTGNRSGFFSGQLTTMGFTNIIDVPEGMLGSSAGAGWIATGLPVVQDDEYQM